MDKGSSPTPGASDVDSITKRNKNKQRELMMMLNYYGLNSKISFFCAGQISMT
jgi:hypothetical protein